MRAYRLGRQVPAMVLMTGALLITACGDDDTTTVTEDTLVGSWNVTSLTAPSQPQWGDAISDDGLTVSFTFSAAGGYTLAIAGDWPADPWICFTGSPSCTITGTWELSGGALVLDAGTADEVTVSHTLSGDNLTLMFPAGNGINDPYRYVMRRN